MRLRLLASACLFAIVPAAAFAQDAGTDDAPDTRFGLGQIVVSAQPVEGISVGSSTLGHETIEAFARHSLDDALNLMPGVTSANGGGGRNERMVYVRGFDRFQMPLSIDGIRVYLPADNRLDYARFLTADVSEIQVAKGYASVLNGPGAMGGAINLVTRKPARELEAEAGGTLELDRDGGYSGYTAFGLLGTKQDQWYAQASFARSFRDHWDLPGSFEPTRNEDGGARDLSRTEDWRLNLKAGFTPNATDEYSISYTRQEGAKQAPLHLTSSFNRILRNWTWPDWDIESIYFLSTTDLGSVATLKTRLYHSKFYNMLRSFDDATLSSQTMGYTFDSPYDDKAQGGSIQLDFPLGARDTLSLAVHYRRDEHNESQTGAPDLPGATAEPVQQSLEKTWSIAAENRLALSDGLSLTLGASYDWRNLERAEEYDEDLIPPIYNFPMKDADGWNAQGRIDWTGASDATAYASVSSRIRFPTLFERFSSQFGTAEPNPDLKPERATNFEIGGSLLLGAARLSGALFYSLLDDALVSVRTTDTPSLNRRENIGSANYYGAEISLDATLAPSLQAGANYTFIHRNFDLGTPPADAFLQEFRLTDVPEHKGFAWLSWEPVAGLTFLPSMEFASGRKTVEAATAEGNAPVYYDLDGYVNVAFRVDYDVTENITLGAGARNLFDKYYVLTDGFPEPGRSFFLSARARY